MKTIDCSPNPKRDTPVSKLLDQAQEAIGLSTANEQKAQEKVVTQLSRSLSNQFSALRNVCLEQGSPVIPIILIGPPGVVVINTSPVKGVYRAKNDQWTVLAKDQIYIPARPNLVIRTQSMAQAVQKFLQDAGIQIPEVEGVLVFSEPGMHLEAIRPIVRMMLLDGINRFSAGVEQRPAVFDKERVYSVSTLIANKSKPPEPEEEEFVETLPPLEDPKAEKPAPGPVFGDKLSNAAKKINLSRKQAILLAVMALVEVLILIGFIILIAVFS